MSDEAISSGGETGAAAPATTVEAVKTAGLHQMAQADDGGDYHAERLDQATEESGAELSSDRKAARAERYRRAVESAQQHVAEKRDASAPESAMLARAAGGDSGNEQEETREQFEARIRDQTQAQTKFAMRAEAYLQKNPGAKADVAVLDYLQPAPHISQAIINSEHGPALAHRIALNPDSLVWLNSLPPMEAARVLGQVEGSIVAQEMSAPAQTGGRRTTNATAPMSTVRGGASPTPDLTELAKRDDATAYHNARRAQERDGRR